MLFRSVMENISLGSMQLPRNGLEYSRTCCSKAPFSAAVHFLSCIVRQDTLPVGTAFKHPAIIGYRCLFQLKRWLMIYSRIRILSCVQHGVAHPDQWNATRRTQPFPVAITSHQLPTRTTRTTQRVNLPFVATYRCHQLTIFRYLQRETPNWDQQF